MLARTRWRVVEEPCRSPAEAAERWRQARAAGAVGAVTSWGSGIASRRTLRLYWELEGDRDLPDGEDLTEENWTPYWRASLGIVRVTPSLALVPAWEEVPADVARAIRLDPGMAFGAGDHPTTRLCLQLLEELAERGQLPERVLDVGTGTGVLALAAGLLGAQEASGLDIDPFGFAACRRNARLNGLESAVRPLLLSLDLFGERYPLVVANVVASQLAATAPHLRDAVVPGGRLLLSGFGARAEEDVLRVMGSAVVTVRREEDGWRALLLRFGRAAQ